VQIGAADCVDRICERIEQAAAHPQPIVRPSASSQSRTVQRQRTWPKALRSVSSATVAHMQPSRSSWKS
jgi:hypothetical protein